MTISQTSDEVSQTPAKALQVVLIVSITWLALRVGYRCGYTDGQRAVLRHIGRSWQAAVHR